MCVACVTTNVLSVTPSYIKQYRDTNSFVFPRSLTAEPGGWRVGDFFAVKTVNTAMICLAVPYLVTEVGSHSFDIYCPLVCS